MSRDLPRLYLNPHETSFSLHSEIVLSPSHAHYLSSVLRVNVGDGVRIFNGHDGEWEGRILEIKKKEILISLEAQLREQVDLPSRTLLFSPLKRDATELIYRMGTELGVTCFQPIITERTNTHRLNLQRLAVITQEAAEQCERLDIPKIEEPILLKSLLLRWPQDTYIAAAIEKGAQREISLLGKEILWKDVPSSLLIGPEGGFSEEEVALLKKYPFIRSFSLGDLVLRAETAVVAGLSQLSVMPRLV